MTSAPEGAAERPGKCPGCGTADLTHGRTLCQACGVLRALGRLASPPAADSDDPSLEAQP